MNIKDDPDYDLFGIANMYTDTDYKETVFQFGEKQIMLYALHAASTDYDLTGQIVWEAASIFSAWIYSGIGESLFKNQRVLELGSGPGLGGFAVAEWAKTVTLTDY